MKCFDMQLMGVIALLCTSILRGCDSGAPATSGRLQACGQRFGCTTATVEAGATMSSLPSAEAFLQETLHRVEKDVLRKSLNTILARLENVAGIFSANAAAINATANRRAFVFHHGLEPEIETVELESAEHRRPELLRPDSVAHYAETERFSILEQLKLEEQQQQHTLHKSTKRKKKGKKKKRKGKRKKKKKHEHETSVGDAAQVIFASVTQKPWHYIEHPATTTTQKPKRVKYIIRNKSVLKKKKKEYLNHLKHVIYPFVKFVAFFTVLNPFTFAVFFFKLISPIVFGFLGFMALSLLVKPALHLLFDVKRRVDTINQKKWLAKRRRERLRLSKHPITIHKHFYKNWILPKTKADKVVFNPILPRVKSKIQHGTFVAPQFVRHEKLKYG